MAIIVDILLVFLYLLIVGVYLLLLYMWRISRNE